MHGRALLFQQIGDIFATEGLIGPGVFQGALHFFHAVDFAQGDDLLHMVAGIAPFFLQALIILRRARATRPGTGSTVAGIEPAGVGPVVPAHARAFQSPDAGHSCAGARRRADPDDTDRAGRG